MWVYKLLDILVTLSQAAIALSATNSLCKNPRSKFSKWIPPVILSLVAYFWTWIIEDGSFKMPTMLIVLIISCISCYRDSIRNNIVAALMGMVFMAVSESVVLLSLEPFVDSMTVNINGVALPAIPVYLGCLFFGIIASIGIYLLFHNYRYQLAKRDFVVVFSFEMAIFLLLCSRVSQYVVGAFNRISEIIVVVLSISFVILFLYLKNNYYLREQGQRDKMQIAQLQQQYAYYQDKLKDEERIRSIYHDMKNHLLVLEGSQGTDETRRMARDLRSQIADYENYIHTGNDFLDIIIRDKAEKAREKQIDFSAFIDFGGVDFIEPLDISTLFGNGIDNSIEASEKLPEEQRVILVKAGKVQDFVSILIENNCTEETHADGHTTKADKFLHGFGISNMKKAAEKYGGSCTTMQENGKFTLKILLPSIES